MATHRTVSQYQQSKENWKTYVERLNHYFIANDVADDGKKRSILLSACGSSTYKLMKPRESRTTGNYALLGYHEAGSGILPADSLGDCSKVLI